MVYFHPSLAEHLRGPVPVPFFHAALHIPCVQSPRSVHSAGFDRVRGLLAMFGHCFQENVAKKVQGETRLCKILSIHIMLLLHWIDDNNHFSALWLGFWTLWSCRLSADKLKFLAVACNTVTSQLRSSQRNSCGMSWDVSGIPMYDPVERSNSKICVISLNAWDQSLYHYQVLLNLRFIKASILS